MGLSSTASPVIDVGHACKKKCRPLKNLVVDDYEPSGSGKRERGSKVSSVTPSIVDDDNG
jgi:hypothetical protein